MNKKGAEEILVTVGYIVIFLVAYFSLMYWMNDVSTGEAAIDQSIAKQAALLIDSADLGTEILFDKELKVSGKNVVVGEESYSFFSRYGVSSEKVEGGTKLIIKNA
ncbi:hypothetical protein ACFLZZ_02120 [Nanoarchaeota archaeon]